MPDSVNEIYNSFHCLTVLLFDNASLYYDGYRNEMASASLLFRPYSALNLGGVYLGLNRRCLGLQNAKTADRLTIRVQVVREFVTVGFKISKNEF